VPATAPIAQATVGVPVGIAPPTGTASPVATAAPATPAPEIVAPPPSPPAAEVVAAPATVAAEASTPPPAEMFAAPGPTPDLTVGPITLTADLAIEQVVERASLPPEARLLARTLRPTFTAEYEEGYWTVGAGPLGRWRVSEVTWDVEPADGVAELWEIQSRLDLR
jgi:hypothetical protein